MGNFAVMNNPFDYVPDARCDEAFRRLVDNLEFLKRSDRPEDLNFIRELGTGKMLGVLIATDGEGMTVHFMHFSGRLGNGGFHYDGFVGPVFDYLHPDGYFKRKEADISLKMLRFPSTKKGCIRLTKRL